MPSVRRSVVLLLAYLASALVSTLVVAMPMLFHDSDGSWSGFTEALDEMRFVVPLILILGVPVAWIPLIVGLALALRAGASRLLACLCACVFTASVLVVWETGVIDRYFSIDPSPLDAPMWLRCVEALPYALPAGAFGGLAFWVIAFGTRRVSSTA